VTKSDNKTFTPFKKESTLSLNKIYPLLKTPSLADIFTPGKTVVTFGHFPTSDKSDKLISSFHKVTKSDKKVT
jgi:hypothetical protein